MEVKLIDSMGSDVSVVNAARVSFGKKLDRDFLRDEDIKLIKYLAKHRHMSPFGHAFASFHVTAPIFVARQLVKHKFLRWNEISRRYVKSKPEFHEPSVWREATNDKKQGSGGQLEWQGGAEVIQLRNYKAAESDYYRLLEMGVCEEQARMVLPLSAITEWYWSGSLDAFADMCLLRLGKDAQAETQIVAHGISLQMSKLFPVSWLSLVYERIENEQNN